MVEVRFYIEGGGQGDVTRRKMREGFVHFLTPLREIARDHRVTKWEIISAGSRQDAYNDFCSALKSHPTAFNVLLVDAEDALPETCNNDRYRNWEHLQKRDKWDRPADMDDSHCFLMIHCMETWLIADKDAVAKYYGAKFNDNALPKNRDLESVPKVTLADALDRATRDTQKGAYHKTKHAFDILRQINVATVRAALPECDRLFTELEASIKAG